MEPVQHYVRYGGLGIMLVVTSALALEERYYFKLPRRQAVPAVLGVSVTTWLAGLGTGTAGWWGCPRSGSGCWGSPSCGCRCTTTSATRRPTRSDALGVQNAAMT